MRLEKTCRVLMAPVPAFVMYYWTRTLGEEFEAISRFLLPTDELAVSYPRFDNWCGYRVVVHDDGRIVGTDDEDYTDRVKLTKQDVVLHKFDLKKFRNEMCPAFGLKAAKEDTGRPCWSMSWGVWEPEKGATFPVTLWYARDNFKERVLERILKRSGPGEILLTATRLAWNDELEQIARQNKIMLIPLQEVVQAEDGKILPTPEWNEYMTAFRKMVECDLPSSLQNGPEAAPFKFRRKGQMWVVRFSGREMFLKDGVGPQHISVLLSQPGQSIYAVDLQMIAAKQDTEAAPRPTAAGEMSDSATIRDVEGKARELLAELDAARRDGNSILESEIEDEIDQLKNYLCQVKGMGGEARKSNNPADSIRRSVQQMIKKTVETIGAELPDCASHLSRSIRTGFVVGYNPVSEVQWVL